MHPKLAYEHLAGPWKVNGVVITELSVLMSTLMGEECTTIIRPLLPI